MDKTINQIFKEYKEDNYKVTEKLISLSDEEDAKRTLAFYKGLMLAVDNFRNLLKQSAINRIKN